VPKYTTVDAVLAVLPDLGSATTLSSAHIASFIDDAEAEIDAVLVRRYTLPLSGSIPYLRPIATDMAAYRLVTRRAIPIPSARAQDWVEKYGEAKAALERVATGAVSLVTSSGELVPSRTDIGQVFSTTKGYAPTFHEGPVETQVQDPQKIWDEIDRRRWWRR
jgi:phage gp36-like protein